MLPQLTLQERTDHWAEDLTIDREQRLVRNVALAGLQSRNGYRYTELALQSGVSLYEQRPVFLDHGDQKQRPLDRSTRDLVGTILNPRYAQGRIHGDIHVLETESGDMFLKLVESNTPGVGMSHVVLARRSDDGKSVEQIVEVVSVDVVINPATTSTFREAVRPGSTFPTDSDAEPESLRQARDALLEENRQLRQQLGQASLQGQVEQLLRQSGLPGHCVSDCFRQQLRQAESEEARRSLIEDRRQLLSEARRSTGTNSQSRAATGTSEAENALFLKVLRRSNSPRRTSSQPF